MIEISRRNGTVNLSGCDRNKVDIEVPDTLTATAALLQPR